MALDGKTDFYSLMIYSSGLTFYSHLKYAVDNLKHAKVFPWIDPSEESGRFFSRYSPEKVRQNMVAAIALNAMGMMIYPTDILDGSYMKVISETADILAGAEHIYRGRDLSSALKYDVSNSRVLALTDEKGRRIKMKYPDLRGQVRAHLHEKDGVYILSVLNYSGEKVLLKIALPEYRGKAPAVVDLIARKKYAGVGKNELLEGFVIEIPADGTAVVRIGERSEDYTEVTQKELLNFSLPEDKGIYGSDRKGGTSYCWRLFKNRAMLSLGNGKYSVTLNPEHNGRIEELRCGDFIPAGKPDGMMGDFQFYDLSQPKVFRYDVESIKLNGKEAEAILTSMVKPDTNAGGAGNPLTGLLLKKVIRLDADGKLTIFHSFENSGSKDMSFGFRTLNMFTSAVTLLDGVRLNPPDGIFLRPGAKIEWFALLNPKNLSGKGEVIWQNSDGKLEMSFPDSAGVYFWHSPLLQTVEPLFSNITLSGGERYTVKNVFKYTTNPTKKGREK